MATPMAFRAAEDPDDDYVEQILDEVRKRIAPEDRVLDEARERRNQVRRAAEKFAGALRSYNSGSLAHGTVNDPVSDADGGVVLDRRAWYQLGPDRAGEGPCDVVEQVAAFVFAEIGTEWPYLTYKVTKRAILFEFDEPIDDEDPSVDLIVGLTRRDKPGLWIPNTERNRWDASDPEKHTALLTAPPKQLRVFRARVIRLAKAAIKCDEKPVLISFNIEALALEHVTETGSLSEGLAIFFAEAATSIRQGLTPDPAGVSPPIKLPEGVTRETAARRLAYFATKILEAIEHRDDHTAALRALGEVFPQQLPEAPRSSKSQLASALRVASTGPAVASAFGTVNKTPRSYGGDAQA